MSVSLPTHPRLVGIRAKIERAEEHIRDLESRIRAFRQTEPYRIVCDQDSQPPNRIYRVQIRSQPPPVMAVIAGEVIQHLRSVLDHLAWQLVEANSKKPTGDTCFPIYNTSTEYKTKPPGKVKGISTGAEGVIESVQPYQSGYGPLWELHKLNNFDKHRLLLIVGFGLHEFRFSAGYRHPFSQDERHKSFVSRFFEPAPLGSTPPPKFAILQDGAEIGMNWIDGPPTQDEKFDLTYEIAFGKPEIVEGKPVLPFLHQAIQLVEQVVGLFVSHRHL